MPREVSHNDVWWHLRPGHDPTWYLTDYYKLVDVIRKDNDPLGWYADTIRNDLYFILRFVLKIPGEIRGADGKNYLLCDHPFVIKACTEVQRGPKNNTLDLWFRGGFKSSIITQAEIIQKLCRDGSKRIALFSHSKAWCLKSFFHPIKRTLEESALLKAAFPDTFYDEPQKQAWKWADEIGLFTKQASASSAREASLGAYGLIDAMPTGGHFTDLYFDDIMVEELVNSPEQIEKLKRMYDMAMNLTTVGATKRLVGTTYHHDDVYQYLKEKKDPVTDKLIYETRIKPATHDGTITGRSVFHPEEALSELKANRQAFNSQQLLNPTPLEDAKLDWRYLKLATHSTLPKRIVKFLVVDPAGENKSRIGDAWAFAVLGFEFVRDEQGFSNVYILDLVIDVMTMNEALTGIVDMYARNGRIAKVCVEKIGMSTMEIHVKNALAARGKHVSLEAKTLHVLQPAGRSKEFRIISNVQFPLNNSKIHVLDTVPNAYVQRLRLEMEKFPYWHDDGLDVLSYGYDVARSYPMGRRSEMAKPVDAWERAWREEEDGSRRGETDWLIV